MLYTRTKQCRCLFILFTSITLCSTQLTAVEFHAPYIEIIPNRVVINSTSITDFICINHQSNQTQLEANLSKIIPTHQILISTKFLNETSIHIRLESNNYVGIFHLLCYSKGEQSKGNRADIIVKGASGVLQLAEKCRVYDRQYIKCVIRALTIATAIQNGYPPTFEFNEISHSLDQTAYLSRVEFVKNESTNEYIVFKWKPTVEGEFPNGVRMNIKAMLPYFDVSSYYFDMTPVFRIKPKFILQAVSSSEIQINLTPISPPAFCEKSIVRQLTSTINNQTWTVIEPERYTILMNNLFSGSIYRVCIKCRQVFSDPDGLEECQEMKTLSRISLFLNRKFFILIIIILTSILFIIIVFSFLYWYRQRSTKYSPVKNKDEVSGNRANLNEYSTRPPSAIGSIVSIHSDELASAPLFIPNDSDNDRPDVYLPIASMSEVFDASFPKIVSSSEH